MHTFQFTHLNSNRPLFPATSGLVLFSNIFSKDLRTKKSLNQQLIAYISQISEC